MSFNSFPISTSPLTTQFPSLATAMTSQITWGGNHVMPGLEINRTVNAGTGNTLNSKGFFINESFQGSASGQIAFNLLNVTSDTATGTTGALATPFQVTYSFGGAAMVGNRVGINVNMTLTAATNNNITGGGAYAAFSGQCVGASSDGGTGLTNSTAKGNCTGANLIGSLHNGATNMHGVQAAEFNVNAQSGSSTYNKVGIAVICLSTDAVQGSVNEGAISIVNQPGTATSWANGILLGRDDGQWPFGSTSSLLSTFGSAGNLLYGIDLSAVTLASGGAGFLQPLTTPSSSSATGKTGSILWDSGFIYICTASNTWKRVALSTF